MAPVHDVIVIGLGGVGSAAAYHLAAAGQRVLGLEQYTPVHARGASHGLTRGVWQAYFMGPGYVPLLQRAYELWNELSRVTGTQQFVRTGGMCLGPEDGTLVPAALASARACDLPHELLTATQVRRRFPTFSPAPEDLAVYDPTSGYVRPEQTVRAHLDLASAAGADLRFEQEVLEVRTTAAGVEVRTAADRFMASKVVVAAGCWLPTLLPETHLPVQVVRKVMHWYQPAGPLAAFEPGKQPYWIWEGDGRVGYGHPAVDGPGGGVKAGFHDAGDPCDPDDDQRPASSEEVEEMTSWLRGRLPELPAAHLQASTCLYDNTPDLGFLLGPLADEERVIIAGGTSGHAFKFVPALGEALAQLVVDGKSRHDLSLFVPDRFEPAAPVVG